MASAKSHDDRVATKGAPDPKFVLIGNHKFDRTLLFAYMAEHYEAAREHLAARREMIAFLFAASTALALEALKDDYAKPAKLVLSATIIAIGIYAALSSRVHGRANRLHVETATACRKLLAGLHTGDGHLSDPHKIRSIVENRMDLDAANVRFEEICMSLKAEPEATVKQGTSSKPVKIGDVVSAVVTAVPVVIVLAGLAVGWCALGY